MPDEYYPPTVYLRRKAALLIDLERWEQALESLALLLSDDPDDYDAHCQKAICHYELGQYQAGYDATKSAIKISPECEWAYRLQSVIFAANGEYRRALNAAVLGAAIAPDLFEAQIALFYAQAKLGLHRAARDTLKIVLRQGPDSARAHLAVCELALREKQLERAETAALNALKLDPQSAKAHSDLGVVYLNMVNFDRGEQYREMSVEMFNRALKIQPTLEFAKECIDSLTERRSGTPQPYQLRRRNEGAPRLDALMRCLGRLAYRIRSAFLSNT